MLLQIVLIQRIIIALIFQVWPVFYLTYLTYKLLKRARNRSTYTLSSVFIFNANAYLLTSLSVIFVFTPFAYYLYVFGIFFFIMGTTFFVVTSWVLVKLEKNTPYWLYRFWFIGYIAFSSYVIIVGFFFGGIKYDVSTGWIPTYSWFFLILSWILLLVFMVIPQIILSVKLVNVFEGKVLKERIYLFLIGVFFLFSLVFALILYNTWLDNQVYRIVYLFIFPPLGTIGAYLIYRSFVKELD